MAIPAKGKKTASFHDGDNDEVLTDRSLFNRVDAADSIFRTTTYVSLERHRHDAFADN